MVALETWVCMDLKENRGHKIEAVMAFLQVKQKH